MQNEMKYFVFGHTAKGLVNYLDSNVVGLKQLIVVQHQSNTIISQIIGKLKQYYMEFDQVEVICSPQSKKYIDGIIMRSLSIAILSSKIVEHKLSNAIYINMEEEPDAINTYQMEMYNEQQKNLFQKAYNLFEEGLLIHDQLEEIYIKEMEFAKADREIENMISFLFKNKKKLTKNTSIYKRLFGTNTAEGMVNYVENLIEPLEHRIFIKGRAGTGKSYFMNKILEQCKDYGFDVELYFCSFDPNSIDMLIIKELNCCLFDSTPPHEFFPNRKGDIIVDLYEKTVHAGTDEKYADEIRKLTSLYKEKVGKGLEMLERTKVIENVKEEPWEHMSINNFNDIMQQIIQKDGKVKDIKA